MTKRVYKPNPKHKRGAIGEGPPRWFTSSDSLCPDTLDFSTAQALLNTAISGKDQVHPDQKALYALHEGTFYKAYCQEASQDSSGDTVEYWHGYPVRKELVPTQIPSRILREFLKAGSLSKPEYKKLLGNSR